MAGLTLTVGGNDITNQVDVESIRPGEVGSKGVGTFSFRAHDLKGGGTAIATGDAVDVDDDGTTIWAGEVARVTRTQAGMSKFWQVDCQDYNAILDYVVIASESYAQGTADSAIVDDLFNTYRADIDSTTEVATLDANMEAISFTAMTLRECLDLLAERCGARYYVDRDKNLHWFATEAAAAPFSLHTTPDMAASFPFEGYQETEDGTRLVTHVLVQGKGEVSAWYPATQDWSVDEKHAVVRDNKIETSQAATDLATQIYNRYSSARTTFRMRVREDGLDPGDQITLVNELWGVDAAYYVRSIDVSHEGMDGDHRLYDIVLGDEPVDAAEAARARSFQLAKLEAVVYEVDTISARGWSHDLVFSATDNDTVAWAGGGTIYLAGGVGSYAIDAGNTGNIAAITYIFLDVDVSTTVLQTDTDAANAVGAHKILLCVAKNVADAAKYAVFQAMGVESPGGTFVTADVIAADTITGNEIAVNSIAAGHIVAGAVETAKLDAGAVTAAKCTIAELSAITADLGLCTAGEIRVGAGTVGVDFTGYRIFSTYLAGYNDDTRQVYIDVSDGKFYAGGGAVTIDEDGIEIAVGTSTVNELRWAASGVRKCYLYGWYTGGDVDLNLIARGCDAAGDRSMVRMIAYEDDNVTNTQFYILASTNLGMYAYLNRSFYINETANGKMSMGLTINQGANDDEALALKSSDVAHGYTSGAETDTYLTLKKAESAGGGAMMSGHKDSGGAAVAAIVAAYCAENANTGKNTSSRALINMYATQTSGNSLANVVANGNVFSVSCRRGGSEAVVLIVDEDGDLHIDGSTAAYDAYDDALLARDLAQVMAGGFERNRALFEELGIIGPADAQGRFLMSTKRTTALLLGAVGQLWQRCERQEKAIETMARGMIGEGEIQD